MKMKKSISVLMLALMAPIAAYCAQEVAAEVYDFAFGLNNLTEDKTVVLYVTEDGVLDEQMRVYPGNPGMLKMPSNAISADAQYKVEYCTGCAADGNETCVVVAEGAVFDGKATVGGAQGDSNKPSVVIDINHEEKTGSLQVIAQ